MRATGRCTTLDGVSRTSRRADRALIAALRGLEADGFVVGTVGNASRRTGDALRITPTRAAYARMRPRALVTVGLDGVRRGAGAPPSRELPLHLAVYRARPDAGAIVHTHSPRATAWSFLGRPLEPDVEESAYYGIGAVRTSEPAPAGSDALAAAAAEGLGDGKAVLLAGHGVIAVGRDVAEATIVARSVEHQATIAWLLAGVTADRLV